MKINSFIYLSVTVIIVVLSSCRNEPILSNGNYEVSGIVYKDGNPSSNTNILLQKNNEIIDETFSSSTGHFKFENVEQGYYSLVAKQLSSNGSFLNSPTSINVNQDIFIDNLLLPKPVELLQLINRTTRTIELKWTKYSGEGFYEYKVYRHNSTALDETTGTLIHISTNNEDTTFIDSGQENGPNIGLWPNSNFYYRVYINNEYGKMGGSNILETKTKEWENEENFTVFYSLEPLMSFSTPQGYITGLDSDGNNIYVLIVEDIGGFYTNNIVKILKYDIESNTPLDTLTYDDEYIIPRALTYADGYLWVYYDDLGSPWIKKISVETGDVVQIFNSSNMEDMAYFNGFIYETRVDIDGDLIRKVSLNGYNLISTFRFMPYEGIIDGIAVREDEIWITSRFSNKIVVLDSNGDQIGVVETTNTNGGPGFKLCFINNKISYNDNGKINIFNILN